MPTGCKAGKYKLLIQTYAPGDSELARKEIDILLEEPKYAEIIPYSENKKEFLVNDKVVYKARVEGSGFTHGRFIIKSKVNNSGWFFTPQSIRDGEDLELIWYTTNAEPGEYIVCIEVYCEDNDSRTQIVEELEDTIILREQPSAKIVKFSPEDGSTYSSNDNVTLEADVEGSGYKYFRYIVNSENDAPVYDTGITEGEITPVQWNTAGYPAGVYTATVSIYDANEDVLDVSSTKITLTETNEIKYGDVDDSGDVNALDLAHMRKYLLGMTFTFPSQNGSKAADLNGDGEINALDLALLESYLSGRIKKFPIENKV